MKTSVIAAISFYQHIVSPFVKMLFGIKASCRFYPTCSAYAKQTILSKGVLRGGWLSLIRLIRCQPYLSI